MAHEFRRAVAPDPEAIALVRIVSEVPWDLARVAAAVAELCAGQADRARQRATITADLAQIATRERRLLDALVPPP